MTISIRKAIPNDFEAILQLIQEFALFQKTPEKISISIHQMHQNAHLFNAFVAETTNHQIVGFASFFFAYYSWSGKALYLDDLYIREPFRKNKAGSKLLMAVIDLAKAEQCIKLRWQVSKWNENAINFYQKLGAQTNDTEMNVDYYLK